MSKEILLIDDDAVTNFINQDLIEFKFPGIPIVVLYNGADAYKYILENKQKELIVFLDLNMPIMNGWELLELLETGLGGDRIKIHVLTSSINPQDKERTKLYGHVESFIEKPLDENLLEELLMETIKGSGTQ